MGEVVQLACSLRDSNMQCWVHSAAAAGHVQKGWVIKPCQFRILVQLSDYMDVAHRIDDDICTTLLGCKCHGLY